jgi:hypothetical protein
MRWLYLVGTVLILTACQQDKPLEVYLYGSAASGTHFHFSFSELAKPSGNETVCRIITDNPKTHLDCQNAVMEHPYQEVTKVSFAIAGTLDGHPYGQIEPVSFQYSKVESAAVYQLTGNLSVMPRLVCVVASETDVPPGDPAKSPCPNTAPAN